MNDADVYPVGLLRDLRLLFGRSRLDGSRMDWSRLRWIRRTVAEIVRKRDRRRLRNYLNGYLAEHPGHAHNAGHAWTKRAAARHADAICEETNR